MAWNELGLAEVRGINRNRKKMLMARVKEYGEESVLEAIGNIHKSTFLRGQNKSGWTITFDWFIRPNNFPKVLEGNYTDKNKDDMPAQHNYFNKNDPQYGYEKAMEILQESGVLKNE